MGLLLALLAAGGVYLLGSLGGGGPIGGGPTQNVVVAKSAIPLRHQITKDDLDVLKNVSTNVINVYTNVNEVVGFIAQVQITKGAVITKDMLAKDIGLVSGIAPAYLPLAKGYVAVTIPTSEQVGVAGHITLGDYITVVASGQTTLFPTTKKASAASGTAGTTAVSKTVFTNVRIIGLGPATSNVQPASGPTSVSGAQPVGVTSSLTIELTQCDAEFFTWFLNTMQVKYTLESFADYLATPPTGPDPTCPDVLAAHGVTVKQVDARYHFTTL